MLDIANLHATVADKPILNGVSLHVPAGEVHAIMGPNGSGKSTLAYVLAGRPGYEVTDGSVSFDGQDLLAHGAARARRSRACSSASSIRSRFPDISYLQFLRESLNSQRRARGEAELSGGEFIKLAREQAALLGMDAEMLKRPVNVGFSGGEKKRAEMVQMGIMAAEVRGARRDRQRARHRRARDRRRGHQPHHARADKGVLLITHYQRLLDYVEPDRVHVLQAGRITRSGGLELARELEREGYAEAAA